MEVSGTNAWWLAHLSENSDVDLALSQIASVLMPSLALPLSSI